MKVLVTVPNQGLIHKHCVFALLKIERDKRHSVQIMLPTHRPFENNLHHIIRDFLNDGYDYWLSFDADNPPMKNPLDLIDLNKDIIGLPTPVWHYTGERKKERPIYWNGYDYVSEKDAYKEHELKEGLQRVDAVGTGCFLVKKEVFQDWDYSLGAPFTRKLLPNGIVDKGSDIAFCERAREQGLEIYMHYDYPCMHFVELELMEVSGAFKDLYE